MDWLPSAVRDPHPRAFPWAETTDPKGCLHTTESSGWPSYDGWTIMPHATIMPNPGRGVTVRQHLPFSQGSFALQHSQSQPTNGDYTFQFELIGTCDPGGLGRKPGPGYYWPDADDAVLLDLYHKVIEPLSTAFGIPLRSPTWMPYDDSYGTSNGVRLSNAVFDTYSGWIGHEHVPQNVHGDPGNFPWARMMALVAAAKPKKDVIRGPLRNGDTGSSVSIAQKHLAIAVDGDFGDQTEAAVRALQKRKALLVDGVIGKQTATAMGCDYAPA